MQASDAVIERTQLERDQTGVIGQPIQPQVICQNVMGVAVEVMVCRGGEWQRGGGWWGVQGLSPADKKFGKYMMCGASCRTLVDRGRTGCDSTLMGRSMFASDALDAVHAIYAVTGI